MRVGIKMAGLSSLGRGPTDMSRYEDPPDNQQYYVNTTAAIPTGHPGLYNTQHSPCSPNTHYFGCKHEKICFCGLTERLPLEVAEGL